MDNPSRVIVRKNGQTEVRYEKGAVRAISLYEFYRLLTHTEWERLEDTTDSRARYLWGSLKAVTMLDLNEVNLMPMLRHFESVGAISAGRAEELRAQVQAIIRLRA